MAKTLFFDLGNVLLFFDHQKMVKQLAELCEMDPLFVHEAMQTYGDSYERGTVDSKEIFDHLRAESKKNLHYETVMDAMGDIFQPNTPTIELALQLKEKGHPIFVLSNTCDAHFRYAIRHFPFLKAFDGHVLSYQVKARKPESQIYKKALEMAGCQREECFYTDDIPEFIEAAKSLQIDAELYTTHEALLQHFSKRKML
jgi:glucose-1-phosphatase